MSSMFLKKEREGVKSEQESVVVGTFSENSKVPGRIEIDLTTNDD